MRPILFNDEMVKAILDDRKVQTRRVVNLKNNDLIFSGFVMSSTAKNREGCCAFGKSKECDLEFIKPKYKVGDVLYVREKCVDEFPNGFCFKDDYDKEDWNNKYLIKQYCNEFNARIFLKVTNVRVERLQDISDRDILMEGCNQAIIEKKSNKIEYIFFSEQIKNWWINLWNSTAKDGYKWENNPYVFAYEFKRVEK